MRTAFEGIAAFWSALLRDGNLAIRSLARTPGFTTVAVASLGLAIGVTSGVAAIVNAYVIQPLPYAASDRMYHVMYAPPGPWEPAGLSAMDWTLLDDVVEQAMTSSGETVFVSPDTRVPSRALYVSPGFLEGTGVRAAAGRVLRSDDFHKSDTTSVMISRRLWQERFGASADAVGQVFRAERSGQQSEVSFRVVGVLPEAFWFGRDSRDLVDILAPLLTPARTYRVRLREHVSAAVAAERITRVVRQISRDIPPTWNGVYLESARERYVAPLRSIVRAIGLASILVLALACANLAVLTVLRALRRQKEIAVRLALGAGRARIARMLVAEAVVLVAVSTLLGLALGAMALDLLGPSIAQQLGRPAPAGEHALRIDTSIVFFVGGLGLLIAGALPLLALVVPWRSQLDAALRRNSRSVTDTTAARRWRSALVAVEIAGSVALLAGSGLMIRSLSNMVRADYGIRTDYLVRVNVDFVDHAGDPPASLAARFEDVVARASALVRAPVPLFVWPQFAESPKQAVDTDGGTGPPVELGVLPVTASYFELLGIGIERGRLFRDTDRIGAERVALVSTTAARRLFPGGDPIGRRLQLASGFIEGTLTKDWYTIVGVVSDVRQTYDDRDMADAYVPFFQTPPARAWLYIRSDQPASQWEAALRREVSSVDPRALVRIAVPLSEEATRQWAAPLFLTGLVSTLAAFAVLFAVLGVYGVTAFSLQRRRTEIAIRSALGAPSTAVVRLFLTESAYSVVPGLAAGLLVSLWVGKILSAQLYGVGPMDPWTLVLAPALLNAIVLVTASRPLVRAARKNPAELLADG